MIALAGSTQEEFERYATTFVAEYAKDLVENYRLSQPEAQARAADIIARSFPHQRPAENHLFFSLRTQDDVHVGFLWVLITPAERSAFIMDFLIFTEWQNKKLGFAALQALSAQLSRRHIESVKLRVAPENAAAIHLYKKAGFDVTGFNMACRIGQAK